VLEVKGLQYKHEAEASRAVQAAKEAEEAGELLGVLK
jgi:hypothetical protein